MDVLFFIVKILIMLAMVGLMALPFAMEFRSFRKDKEKKISYKRLRLVIYTVIFVIGVTLALVLIRDLLSWVGNLGFVQWIANAVALSNRVSYCISVLAAILVNFAIGLLFRLFGRLVRIGLKKKDLVKPKKKNGEYSRGQKLERRIIAFFHNETWFFVSTVLKWLSALLSLAYGLLFFLYQVPAVFGAAWIPYGFLSMLFSAGYVYPVISLLLLWEAHFFLEGIKRLEQECPELLWEEESGTEKMEADLQAIDEEVKKLFQNHYACDVEMSGAAKQELSSTRHHHLTDCIAQAVENDPRNTRVRKETYLRCLDTLVEGKKGVLINGGFFSEFTMYFLRYLSAVIARGDNVVFVCNSDSQITAVYDYLKQGLSEISSLYCQSFHVSQGEFDDPIWKLVKVSGEKNSVKEAQVDECNILVTSLSYLCSDRFEAERSDFISQVDAVVFTDTLNTVNKFNRQLAVLNTRLKHLVKKNAHKVQNQEKASFRSRYLSRQVRYLCFDDSGVPGLDKVLKNLLAVDFDSADARRFGSNMLVRCYRYEAKKDEKGVRTGYQFVDTEEKLGPILNMALLCLQKGASCVNVFADDVIPYANFAETLSSNLGRLNIQVDDNCLRLNRHFYNPDSYQVIIAMDAGENLPAQIRRYAALASEKPALVILFTKPGMLRDYYLGNIQTLWSSAQPERIPVEQGTKKDVAQQIVIRANAGGITKEEILKLALASACFEQLTAAEDVDGILCEVLKLYGITEADRSSLNDHFEYRLDHSFDEHGKYHSRLLITLRRQGKLFRQINGRNMVVMLTGDSEITLPVPRGRLTQNFIAGQNLVYKGNIFRIRKVDTKNGYLYADLAVGGKNDESYRYLQNREYRVERAPEKTEQLYPQKRVLLNCEEDGLCLQDATVSVFRAPAEVLTKSYYMVDPRTLLKVEDMEGEVEIATSEGEELAMQCYRRFGAVEKPYYDAELLMKNNVHLLSSEKGALMMSVRLRGGFGEKLNGVMSLAAAMMGELLKTMFPSVCDSVAVCPVLCGKAEDEEGVGKRLPRLTLTDGEEAEKQEIFELLIIEDSFTDLGVVSVLMAAGDDVLKTLFTPLYQYLKWYMESGEKSDYLYYGLDHEPACFDFASLYKLSALLGDSKHEMTYVDMETETDYDVCDFCGKRYGKSDGAVKLEDGRILCKSCAENLVGNNKKELKAHLDRARLFLESTYGIRLGDDYEVCFESTVQIVNSLKQNRDLKRRGTDIPMKSYVDGKKKVHVEYSLPSANLSELLVRELTHVWQLKHLPELEEELAEGHIALVGIQYLRFLNQKTLADRRTRHYESTDGVAGEGYRRLVRELLSNPRFCNNPFRYLLETCGQGEETEEIIPPTPAQPALGDLGLPYTPSKPDRAPDGNVNYFYRSRLSSQKQQAYDAILEAVRQHRDQTAVEGCSFEEVGKLIEMVFFDHPELFWGKEHYSFGGNTVHLNYGCTAEEAEVLQKRIDEVVPQYLEGIEDSMSAYDVAIRLHSKLVSSVDYDTVTLKREKEQGGPAKDKVDYLRSFCGVFLNGKAVCEGYARAMQYLLQKCGVECAEIAGFTRKENGDEGGAHAWNIVRVDGDYYFLDVTWDDSSDTVQAVKNTNMGFGYFLVTSEEMARSRDNSLSPAEPPTCTAVKANYYTHNDLVLDSYDFNKIKSIAQRVGKNKGSFLSFKCKSKAVYEEAVSKMFVNGNDGGEALRAAAKANKEIKGYRYSCYERLRTVTLWFDFQ